MQWWTVEPVHFLVCLLMARNSFSQKWPWKKIINVPVNPGLFFKSGIYSTDTKPPHYVIKSNYNWYFTFMLTWIVLYYFSLLIQQCSDFCPALQDFSSKNCSKEFVRVWERKAKEVNMKCKLLQLKGCASSSLSFCYLYPKVKKE